MKIIKLLFAVVVVALLFSQCGYNFIVPIPIEEPEVPNDSIPQDSSIVLVSFKTDIIPIFNNGNYCTSCHTTGKQLPDLTPEKAFASLNSTRYINKTTPEESKIYKYPHPDTNTHVQKKYNSAQAAKVLKWIQEGAKNN